MVSTRGERRGMLTWQDRHRPRRARKLMMGRSSVQRSGTRQPSQWEGGRSNDCLRGSRSIQTFKKLPTAAPRMARKILVMAYSAIAWCFKFSYPCWEETRRGYFSPSSSYPLSRRRTCSAFVVVEPVHHYWGTQVRKTRLSRKCNGGESGPPVRKAI